MNLDKLPSLLRKIPTPGAKALAEVAPPPLATIVTKLETASDEFIRGTATKTPLTPDIEQLTIGGAIQGVFCLLPQKTLALLNDITTAGNTLAKQLMNSGQDSQSIHSTLSKLSDGMTEGLPIRTQHLNQGDVVTQAEKMASLVQANEALQHAKLNPDTIEPIRKATTQRIEKQHVPLLEAEGRKAVQQTVDNLDTYKVVDLENAYLPKTKQGGIDMGETPLTILNKNVDLEPLRHTPNGASIFESGNLQGTVIQNSTVKNLKASEADLSGSYVSSSRVDGDFSKADLSKTKLIKSDLTGNFEKANMSRLKLSSGAKVEGTAHSVNLENANIGNNSTLSLNHSNSDIPESSSVNLARLTQHPTSEVTIPTLAGSHNLFSVDPSKGKNNFDQIRWNLPDSN